MNYDAPLLPVLGTGSVFATLWTGLRLATAYTAGGRGFCGDSIKQVQYTVVGFNKLV